MSWPSILDTFVEQCPPEKWHFLSGLDIWFLPCKIQRGINFALLFSGGGDALKCRQKIRGHFLSSLNNAPGAPPEKSNPLANSAQLTESISYTITWDTGCLGPSLTLEWLLYVCLILCGSLIVQHLWSFPMQRRSTTPSRLLSFWTSINMLMDR